MKSLYFLSGLPRSGSTLLGSILSQHPEIQSTPTSPLADLLCWIDDGFSKLDLQYTYDKENIQYNTYNSLLSNFYNHIEKPCVLDKHRGWCKNVSSIEKYLHQTPKIIATTRRIPEVLASYIILIEKNGTDNFIDAHLRGEGKPITTDNRIECLWRNYVCEPYQSLVYGLQHYSQNIHLVCYNDLTEKPEQELNKIYEFLNIEPHQHDFNHILNTCEEEKDDAWGIENLHQIRSKLQRTSPPPEEIIGEENTKLYDLFNI
ncbi:MAG: sulfotransferase family protein [Methylophilaceae bacterium]